MLRVCRKEVSSPVVRIVGIPLIHWLSRTWTAWTIVSIVLLTSVCALAKVEVPVALQGAILSRALSYDQTLKERGGQLRIVLIATGNQDKDANTIGAAFKVQKLSVEIVPPVQASERLKGAAAAYFFPGTWSERLGQDCVLHRVLSISGDQDDAVAARVSLALGVSKGKPELVVNLSRTKTEGHVFSSRLLKLAKVIR